MKCYKIDNYFRKHGTWINWDKTTDIVTFGSPNTEIKKIAVAWKPTFSALKEAKEKGVNLFISHESIAVNTINKSMKQDVEFAFESEIELFDFLTESNMTVYRCHEFLDAVPYWGVMDTWQRKLELPGKIIAHKYPNIITEVKPMKIENLAKHIISKINHLGQKTVLVAGNTDKHVSRIATGTGCGHDLAGVRKLGSDISIVVDDAYNYVRIGSHMRDLDYPLIIVNHGVSEEWAVKNLSEHLQKNFPEIETIYIPQSCAYTFIG
jgi:putative NIF3 family GTP cyclohydrolase 1 type 2